MSVVLYITHKHLFACNGKIVQVERDQYLFAQKQDCGESLPPSGQGISEWLGFNSSLVQNMYVCCWHGRVAPCQRVFSPDSWFSSL